MRFRISAGRQKRRTGAIALAGVLAIAAPLGAQQAPPPATRASNRPATPPQTPAPNAKVLRISMDQAVAMAMEANLGLRSARLNVDIAAQNIVSARASFLPQVRSTVSRGVSERASSSFTDVSQSTISSSSVNVNASVSQTLPFYGGSYSVSWNNSRSTTSSVGAIFNPTLSSTFGFSYSQPLLQGFKIDSARVGLETSERQREITDLDLQSQVVTLTTQVRDAYLNLIAAVEQRKVVGQNMDAAERLLARAKSSLAVGTGAEIDVTQAEANVASNSVSVIGSDEQILNAQDALRALILDPARPDYWDVQFEAADTIEMTPHPVDEAAAIANALANRIDLIEARKNLAITDLTLKLDKDLTRPSMSAVASYSASGTGGTQNNYTQTFPPVLIDQTTKSFGSVLGDTFGGAYPAWSVGVNVSYPIGKTAAESGLARAQVQRRQQEINLKSLEQQVTQSVRQAVRDVQTSALRAQAAATSLDAFKKQYDAEQRKMEVGLSTTFDVALKQGQLAQAALTDLSARIQYNQAVQALERVQRIR